MKLSRHAGLGLVLLSVLTPLDVLTVLAGGAYVVAIVVVCDQQHGDGLDFLEFVKDAHPGIRRIAVAAEGEPPCLERFRADGSVDIVLGQSWDKETLSQALLPLRA